jgi:uncharacterized phiE125 gp8 family phage protein
MQTVAPELITQPLAEPVTLSQAKKHLELLASDTSHDEHVANLIQASREQWEHDTQTVCCTQRFRLRLREFYDGLRLPAKPVSAIVSVRYYDSNNVDTLLPTTIWDFDAARQTVVLKYNMTIPVWTPRYDAWTITYDAGYSDDGALVPMIAKQAMLLLVGHYFLKRGDDDGSNDRKAYESLVLRYMRSSYP